jgi:predicted glycosyltransferase
MKSIWFDFDNAPHVPVLLPIVREMRERGYETFLTAREKAETKELLALNNEDFGLIGKSFPKNSVLKIYHTFKRALNLVFYLRANAKKVNLSISHASRSALLASWLKRIPSVVLYDYEFVNSTFQNIFATRILMPEVFNNERLKKVGIRTDKTDFYPGVKEQIYIDCGLKNKNVLEYLGIDKSKVIITFRPPSLTAHYHNPKSENIMVKIFNKISRFKEKVYLIILPRTKDQAEDISHFVKQQSIPYLIPEKPLNGIDLILDSDLVISGGGTMAREAAVLGVPSYSFFIGPKGAVDEFLEKKGRLVLIDSIEDIKNLSIEKSQNRMNVLRGEKEKIISFICDQLEALIL